MALDFWGGEAGLAVILGGGFLFLIEGLKVFEVVLMLVSMVLWQGIWQVIEEVMLLEFMNVDERCVCESADTPTFFFAFLIFPPRNLFYRTPTFLLEFLRDVLEIENPSEFIKFEKLHIRVSLAAIFRQRGR